MEYFSYNTDFFFFFVVIYFHTQNDPFFSPRLSAIVGNLEDYNRSILSNNGMLSVINAIHMLSQCESTQSLSQKKSMRSKF